jgi:hypothetical protein
MKCYDEGGGGVFQLHDTQMYSLFHEYCLNGNGNNNKRKEMKRNSNVNPSVERTTILLLILEGLMNSKFVPENCCPDFLLVLPCPL